MKTIYQKIKQKSFSNLQYNKTEYTRFNKLIYLFR